MKTPRSILLIFLFLILINSCSRNDCDWETTTQPFVLENLTSNSLPGVYRISLGSTDNSFEMDSLSKSVLYILNDSSTDNNKGLLYFKGFPYWDNSSSKNLLGDFSGSWESQIDKGGIFSPNLMIFTPYFNQNDGDLGKSILMRHDIRQREGKALLIVTVLKNFSNDSPAGNTFVYNSAKSEGACNYLVFSKVSSITPEIHLRVLEQIDSVKSTKH
jgi:hypothetical protein